MNNAPKQAVASDDNESTTPVEPKLQELTTEDLAEIAGGFQENYELM